MLGCSKVYGPLTPIGQSLWFISKQTSCLAAYSVVGLFWESFSCLIFNVLLNNFKLNGHLAWIPRYLNRNQDSLYQELTSQILSPYWFWFNTDVIDSFLFFALALFPVSLTFDCLLINTGSFQHYSLCLHTKRLQPTFHQSRSVNCLRLIRPLMATRFAEDGDHAEDDREKQEVLWFGITSFCLTFF